MTSDLQNICRKEHYNTVRNTGRIVFRPLEARFVENTDKFGNMDPYCKIKLGHHKGKSSVAKNQGKHPIWAGDIITLKRKHDEMYAYLKVKDRDRFKIDDSLGKTVIPLEEIVAKGAVTQWYTLYKKKKVFGEILIAIEFEPKHKE